MGKTFRYDPDDDFGGDHLSTKSKKELKADRRAKRAKEKALEDNMRPDDQTTSDKILSDSLVGGWARD